MGSSAVPNATPYDAAIAEVQTKIEELKTTLATLLRLQAEHGSSPSGSVSLRGNETDISHDTFFNMTIADAAKKYLLIVKTSKPTAEIAAALERGGLKHSSKDFPTTVRSILGQREEFTRVPNGEWGLTEWYPGMRRGRKAKSEKPKKGRKASTRRERAKVSKVRSLASGSEPTAPRQAEEIPQRGPQARIEEYLAKNPDATSREVADKLGIRVQAVTLVMGKLKAKRIS